MPQWSTLARAWKFRYRKPWIRRLVSKFKCDLIHSLHSDFFFTLKVMFWSSGRCRLIYLFIKKDPIAVDRLQIVLLLLETSHISHLCVNVTHCSFMVLYGIDMSVQQARVTYSQTPTLALQAYCINHNPRTSLWPAVRKSSLSLWCTPCRKQGAVHSDTIQPFFMAWMRHTSDSSSY